MLKKYCGNIRQSYLQKIIAQIFNKIGTLAVVCDINIAECYLD